MELALSERERELLLKLLEEQLGELRVEARRTETPAYREHLQEDEDCLRQLVERLRALED